jgi:hypothetical protein
MNSMCWVRLQFLSQPEEEFSDHSADERYVTRRQLTKFLVLTSFGMFVGNIWILIRSLFYKAPSYPQQPVARLGEIPVGGVKLFTYPTKEDHCIMVRTGENEYVSYSQKCTHLSCAVYYSQASNQLECPVTRASSQSRPAPFCKGLRHGHCPASFWKLAASNWSLSR